MKLFKKEISRQKLLYGGLIATFTILYGATAFVSWYHAITFFNIANAVWLSFILSFVAEVGQASALFSLLLTENKNRFLTWFVMVVLTALQVIGNVVSSYDWIIKHGSAGVEAFQKSILFWVQTENKETFITIIAWISGALLPIIALSMTALVAQNLDLNVHKAKTKLDDDSKLDPEPKPDPERIDARDIISEVSKIRPTNEELEDLTKLLNAKKPIEKPPVEEIPFVDGTSFENGKVEITEEKKSNVDTSQFKSPGVTGPEVYSPSIAYLINEYGSIEKVIEKLKEWDVLEKESEIDEEISSAELSVEPHYSDEEINKMNQDEYERTNSYLTDDMDEEAERLTPEIKSDTDIIITHTNGLADGVITSGAPMPEHIPDILPKTSSEEEEQKRLEKLRAVARENLKKK